ncbi:MAG TPA: aromatic acid/H+ symport family MFS transporter [Steroidobacteraceae bacterium]|nr:aromatic acid/H+ symport family MFS transporter [Steroidobacteraceae bacterium]
MSASSQDVQRQLAQGPITAFQLTVIALCVGLNMLDGFDVLAMSFAASGVKADWHLTDGQLGALLSAGLVGMGLGSLTLGPCADRWGRRIIVLLSVAVAGFGMLASALTRDYAELLSLRVLTGIGIGGTIASVAVIVSEYAPEKLRGTALAIYATGYSIGATIGGALAAYAIPRFGWRAAFVIGGTLSLLMLPLAWRKLPESLEFRSVSSQRGPGSIGAQLRLLIRPKTALVWIVFFCTMAGFYFILSWTPRLLNAAGLSAAQGMTGGVLLNLGGIAGCGLFALAASRADTHRLLFGALIGSALLIVVFGLVMSRLDIALWTALLLGIIANAAMAGLYAVGPPLYPTAVRTTGMGWAIGIGRFGAILAPLASGALLDRGWLPAQLYYFFSASFVVAAVAIFLIGPARARAAAQTDTRILSS